MCCNNTQTEGGGEMLLAMCVYCVCTHCTHSKCVVKLHFFQNENAWDKEYAFYSDPDCIE